MNNDTNIKSMPDINTNLTFDVNSQALISAISSAISNGFQNLNSLQVDAVAQIEENTENIVTNTENIETNTQNITTLNNRVTNLSQVISVPYNKKLILHRETTTSRFGFMIGEIFPPATNLGLITLWGYGGNAPDVTQRTNIIETRQLKYLNTIIPDNNNSLDIITLENNGIVTYAIDIFISNLTGNNYTYTLEDIS